MTRWTKEHLQEYMMQFQKDPLNPTEDIPDQGRESVLSGKIVKYCKEHGYPCQCFRQSRKAKGFLVPGLPD